MGTDHYLKGFQLRTDRAESAQVRSEREGYSKAREAETVRRGIHLIIYPRLGRDFQQRNPHGPGDAILIHFPVVPSRRVLSVYVV